MKKAIIPIILIILGMTFVSANLLDQHITGTPDAGTISNTYETNGYSYNLKGREHIFRTQKISKIEPTMFMSIYLLDNNKNLDIEILNYKTKGWEYIGSVSSSGVKVSNQFSFTTADRFNPLDNTMDIRMTASNSAWQIDKFIITSAGVEDKIKRVEQVDWVSNVGSVDTVGTVDEVLEARIEVFGTEYQAGQTAKLWVHLLNETGQYVEDGACQIDIYTPSNEELIEKGAMTNAQHDGVYYYDYQLDPSQPQGVYPAIARCYYTVSEVREYADAFTLIEGKVDDKTYLVTDEIDGQEHKIKQDNDELDLYYTFESVSCKDTDPLLLSGVSFEANVKHTDAPSNDDLIMYWWNWSNSAWVALPNMIEEPNNRVTVSNFITTNNITESGLADSNGDIRFRFKDTLTTDGDGKKTEFDMVNIVCEEFTNPVWTEVRGGSEMHVSGRTNADGTPILWTTEVTSGTITNETLEGYFYINFSIGSSTAIYQEDQAIYFDMYAPFSCHHINYVQIDGVNYSFYGQNPDNSFSGCRVTWAMDLNVSTNYAATIQADKWFTQIENNWMTGAKIQYDILSGICESYRLAVGESSYPIPINFDPKRYGDDFYAVCAQYLDSYWHLNNSYYNEFETINVPYLAPEDMLGLDSFWYHIEEGIQNNNILATTLISSMSAIGAYPNVVLQDPFAVGYQDWMVLFANISNQQYQNTEWSMLEDTVWNAPNRTLTESIDVSNVSINNIGTEVWDYNNRTLSTFDFDVVDEVEISENVWNFTGTISTNILDQFASAIWAATTRTLTAFGFDVIDEQVVSDTVWNNSDRQLTAFGFDVTDEIDIWNYVNRTLSTFEFDLVDESLISTFVWNNTDRQLTAFSFDVTDEASIWDYTNRTLSTFDFDVVDEGLVAVFVWNNTERNLTYFPDATSPAEVWDYNNRTLSSFDFMLPINAPLVAEYIWNSSDRQLTALNFDTTDEAEVWNYVNRTLSTFAFDVVDEQLVATFVWNNTQRNLTYFPATTTLTAQEVWEYSSRNLTYYPTVDLSGIPADIWSYTTRELTGFGFDVVDESLVGLNVWNSTDRQLTAFTFDVTAEDEVWNYFNRTLTEFDFINTSAITDNIASEVWDYDNRTLSTFVFDVVDEELVGLFVWNSTQRNLTYFPAVDPIDYDGIRENVWNYTARYTHGVVLN